MDLAARDAQAAQLGVEEGQAKEYAVDQKRPLYPHICPSQLLMVPMYTDE